MVGVKVDDVARKDYFIGTATNSHQTIYLDPICFDSSLRSSRKT